MKTEDIRRTCVDCGSIHCCRDEGEYPPFCLTANMEEDLLKEAMEAYEDPEDRRIAVTAAEVEADYYLQKTRVEEIVLFAKKMGFRKLGIATCVGLIAEARIAAGIFRANGFEVVGMACKCGAQKKTSVGIPERCDKVGDKMCNPVLQAKFLNREKTDLNIVIGLCVGHDSLFYKHIDGLCTTLVTKDRVMAHNPAAALYQADKYYKRLMEPQEI